MAAPVARVGDREEALLACVAPPRTHCTAQPSQVQNKVVAHKTVRGSAAKRKSVVQKSCGHRRAG